MHRRTLSMALAALALCSGSGLISAGCAASGPPTRVELGTPEHPLAESTLSYLTDCAKRWGDDLQGRSYKLQFNVTVDKRGWVSDVDPEGPRLDVRDMEKCMIGALRNMSVPPFVYEKVSSERAAQRVPAHARGLVGDAATMEQVLVTLAPVIIEAGPVVIIVVIGVVVVAAMASSVDDEKKERCREERRKAWKHCLDYFESRNPPRGVTGGYRDMRDCIRGLVSEDCGGNDIDWGDEGRPGRRY